MNEIIIDTSRTDDVQQPHRDPRLTRSEFGESLALDRYARRLDSQEARIQKKLRLLGRRNSLVIGFCRNAER